MVKLLMLLPLGSQGDISNLCNFAWYEWVYYRDHDSFPENKEKLGHVLGPIKSGGATQDLYGS